MIKLIIYIVLIIVNSPILSAQNSIKGTIADSENGEKLVGVNIYIPELHKGTVTNINGYYQINGIPNGNFKVQYSFIGYESIIETVNFKDSDIEIDLKLESAAIAAQEVIVTGGRTSTQHENAIKIDQIKSSTLENSTETNLMLKLASVPGIDAITKGNGIASPVIRGLSTSNIVLLNNGVRIENFQFSENHPYMIDESDVSSIEIIKGPASLLYGSDAVGGVLNFIKSPPAPVNTIQGNFRTEYNSNYQGSSNSFGLKTSGEDVFGGFSANYSTSKDFRDGSGVIVPNSRNTSYSLIANAGLRIKQGLLKLSYDYNKLTPGLTIPASIDIISSNEYKNEIWYQNLDNHLLSSNNTFFFNRLKLNVDLSYQFNHRRLQGSELTPSYTMVDMGLQNATYQLKSKYNFSDKSNIILAFQGYIQTNRNADAPEHVLPDYTSNNNSLAVLWQVNLEQKSFYQFGFRYDNKWLDVPEQFTSNNEIDRTDGFSKTYNNVSFSAGLTRIITNSLLLRANIASAYRTPSIAELSQDGVHANRHEQGNKDLNPQRNLESDISLHYHSNNLKIEFAGFYNRIFDYIFLSPTLDTTICGLDIYRYEQSNASIYGIEGEFEWKPLSFLYLQTGYAHLIAIQDNNDYLPFIPQDKITSKLVYTKRRKGLMKEINIALNPMFAFKQNKPNKFETIAESYFLFNTSIQTIFQYKKQVLKLGLYINNLFDSAYFDHLSTLKELGYYNMGRNISLKLNIPIN
jgi:iron complex outermembrane recepter protein